MGLTVGDSVGAPVGETVGETVGLGDRVESGAVVAVASGEGVTGVSAGAQAPSAAVKPAKAVRVIKDRYIRKLLATTIYGW